MLQLVKHEDGRQRTFFQADLFPHSDPRSILLVCLPLRTGKEFLQVLERASPRLIVDLRDVPRFDFDFLSRSKVFDTFARMSSTYVDGGLVSEPQQREDDWADLFSRQRVLVEAKKGNPSGPYMFLFSGHDQLPLFEQFLQRELREVNSIAWSIFLLATQEEFAVQKFGK